VSLAELDYCYLTTTGRRSGRPHRIEIWFALHGDTVYLLAGDGHRSDWVGNLAAAPEALLELGPWTERTEARVVEPGSSEDALARRLLVDKYQPGYPEDLSEWGRTALPIALAWPSGPRD
jgi:deazaflavin-dependent oxidoreductase (nitroreductase family)